MRSKAVWGYDDAVLDACREQLRIRPGDVIQRRTVVAERSGTLLGVATLDGDPPDGELGLLFVEPDEMRQGVGRALYRHVLAEAGRLGFRRLAIDADPHAVPFYRAVSAEPVPLAGPPPAGPVTEDALVRLQAWPPAREPSWSAAWDGGAQPVIVGNAAEFNGQFGRSVRGPDHYSCLAAFCATRPAMVLLPMPVEGWWIEHVGAVLGWEGVEVHSGLAGDARMCVAVGSRPDLLCRIAADRSRALPWGWTAEFAAIAPGSRDALQAVRRYESKRHAHTLFRALADGHPRITVSAQRPLGSPRALARELAGGRRVVLKREYGVGGAGTLIVSGDTPGLRPLLRRWARDGALVEEYVEGDESHRDVTFDAVIATDGWVHPVGAGLMHVDGTAYRGVTVGPGVLPDVVARAAAAFGTAVGRVLAADGYHGWFDVDFVATASGRLAPTEINLRLTGPAVAFHVQATLDRRWGGRHVVRTADRLPLGARLPSAALREHVSDLVLRCQGLGATLLVTIPTAAFDAAPYLGVAIAARTAVAAAEAEAAVRQANAALGGLFQDPALNPPVDG
ncbi:GNAT family N-acetyltransferase [Actinoplanes solisilvae]|uniref:GNAT family N-acetyltransferase n=1 Tax=Actinoplanes solisilvae TaxID=2486853 RepID=UPI00196A63BA|nr:GNAT family N-acetyltransferase [Actinoplanes solisilvae]